MAHARMSASLFFLATGVHTGDRPRGPFPALPRVYGRFRRFVRFICFSRTCRFMPYALRMPMNIKTHLGTICIGALAGSLVACPGPAPEAFDCDAQEEAFRASYADDGVLLPEIPDKNSYPMALVLSEQGINNLLTGVVGGNIPFASDLNLGLVEIKFVPIEAPTISIVKVPNCSRCVLFHVDFSFQLQTGEDPGGAGIGGADVAIPLRLQQNEDGSSSLVAGYELARVDNMTLNTMGFVINDEQRPNIQGLFEILVTEALQEQFGTTELLNFQPWQIGGNEVKVAARQFNIFTDTKVIALAMQTNLDLPKSAALAIGGALPPGIPMAVQMHPALLLGMSQRMITEGEISRSYDDKGNPDPNGLYGVTLESMGPNSIPNSNQLEVDFRVWRTEEGYCGYADAVTTLQLALSDSDEISVTPTDDLRVTGGEGIGEIAATDQELVDKNKNLIETFKRDLSDQVGITVNYKELAVEGSTILFDTLALRVDRDKINIDIDFQVVANEGG